MGSTCFLSCPRPQDPEIASRGWQGWSTCAGGLRHSPCRVLKGMEMPGASLKFLPGEGYWLFPGDSAVVSKVQVASLDPRERKVNVEESLVPLLGLTPKHLSGIHHSVAPAVSPSLGRSRGCSCGGSSLWSTH